MAKTEFKKDKKSWIGFSHAINPKGFGREMLRQISKANRRVGELGVRATKKVIQEGVGPPNHALTAAIKGSSKPLVDQEDLFESISYREVDKSTVFVGVLRTSKNYNIAVIVHNGTEIEVTQQMRGLFFALSQVSKGEMEPAKLRSERAKQLWDKYKDWRPIKKSARVITIPARPFMIFAFESPEMKNVAKKIWMQTVQDTIKKRTSKGKKSKGK